MKLADNDCIFRLGKASLMLLTPLLNLFVTEFQILKKVFIKV